MNLERNYKIPGCFFQTQASPVRIDDDTWIGGNVTILSEVHTENPCKVIEDNK